MLIILVVLFVFGLNCYLPELYAKSASTEPVTLTGLDYGISVDTRTNVDKLSDKDFSVRLRAVLALSAERDEKNVAHLVRMLKDKNPGIRKAAINGLTVSGKSATAGAEILKLLSTEKDFRVKVICIKVLGQIKYTEAIPKLKKLLKDQSPVIRTFALKALAEFRYKSISPLIVSMLDDRAEGVKIGAAQVVKELRIKSAQKRLIKNLNHPVLNVRRSMIETLGEVGDTTAKDELENLLDDEKVADIVKTAIAKIKKRSQSPFRKKPVKKIDKSTPKTNK